MLYNVYFSARGTTKTCASYIAQQLRQETVSINWLDAQQRKALQLSANDVLLFSMPVYAGVIPYFCAELTQLLSGEQTPAIVCAVYGNRHYDHALVQMQELLTARGFCVAAAGAFVAAHSIFPKAAAGRPDDKDKAAMAAFAAACGALLQKGVSGGKLLLPGDPAYDPKAFRQARFLPAPDDSCVHCGVCAAVCPREAIDGENVEKVAADRCLSCGACIEACPTGARNHRGGEYEQAQDGFVQRCGAYREPEVFYLSE